MKQLTITSRFTNRETESFNLYLKDIYSLNILTPEQEKELAIKANGGDKEAKDELVRRNLRFVVSVAKQYVNTNNPLEDLINEGNIGLIIAADKFKPEMGWKFISYAVWWITKLILEHLAKHGRIVRLPANKINGLSKLDKKISNLEQKLGRNVDIQEIISEYKDEFGGEDFEGLNVLSTYTLDSLDREIGWGSNDSSNTTIGDMIADTSVKSTDHLIIDSNIKSEVKRIIETLKPRDKRIMIALFGLDGQPPMGLKEVGDEHDISREMVRQIRLKSLQTLKNKLKNNSLVECY